MEHLEEVVGVEFAAMCGFSVPKYSARRETEFEVQAWLYSELLRHGFKVRGEVAVNGRGGWPGEKKGKFHCRFDLVLYDEETPMVIIEVKARPVRHKSGVENTRQGRRYPGFGLPVTFVYGMADARKFVDGVIGMRTA